MAPAPPTSSLPPAPSLGADPAPADVHRTLFQLNPLPMWVYDVETLRMLDVNDVACERYGYTREEFLRLTILDIRPQEDEHLVRANVRDTPANVYNSGVWRHRLRDGTLINVEITSHELVFMERRARLVCPIDVTQRVHAEQALRESEALLQRAQNLARLAHVVTAPDGTFERWSESLPLLLGLAPGDAPRSSRDWLALIHPADREMFRRVSIEAGRVGQRVDVEYRVTLASGAIMHVCHVMEPIESPEGPGGDVNAPAGRRWFNTVQDMTEQQLARQRARLANEELERRVRERTLQLEVSNRELGLASSAAERANRAKSEFLSSMSHELRTPLNAIIGFGQLLAMPSMSGRDETERIRFVDHIVDAGRHLLTLINEVLNLAQIESGKVPVSLERVNLVELLDECKAMVATQATQRGVSLHMPGQGALAVRADRVRLKQVVLNLLSNAIKYNRENGTVVVGLEVGAPGGRVRLRVQDTGPGLTEGQVAGLFQAFNRLGQERSGSEGTGIGLVVTKQLVELMGGSIVARSTPGVGSVFFVELPAADVAELEAGLPPAAEAEGARAAESPAAPEPASPHLATVLCVDDDPMSLRLVREVLAVVPDVQLLTASNGRLGVEMALAHSPALIVMDNNMPEMSGREAQAVLRADARTANIPVIALSANAMPGAEAEGLAAGFFRYLTKPFDFGELRRAVRDALARPAPKGD
jgi:PAS domain S-box-containing protein